MSLPATDDLSDARTEPTENATAFKMRATSDIVTHVTRAVTGSSDRRGRGFG
jgi:hypothetical protein